MSQPLRFQRSKDEDDAIESDEVDTSASTPNMLWLNMRRALSRTEIQEEDAAIKEAAERFFSKLTKEEIRQLGMKRSEDAVEVSAAGWSRFIFLADCVIALICIIAFLSACLL